MISLDLLELEIVIIIFCGVIMFKLLCAVLLGWTKNEGVSVLVNVVVIFRLICFDFFIFMTIIFFLY